MSQRTVQGYRIIRVQQLVDCIHVIPPVCFIPRFIKHRRAVRNRTARSEGLSVYAVKAFRLLTYIKKRTDFLYALLLSILITLFVKTLKKSDFLPIYNNGTQIEHLI